MAFKLNGNPLVVDVAFSHNDIQYPANWLRLSTAEEKTAIGITEVADAPTYDSRFYNGDGSAKALDDENAKDSEGNLLKNPDGSQMVILGVKSILKAQEKATAIPTAITTYRDAVRTACDTREKEIDACSDTAALVTLYSYKEDGTPNMTQYPVDPNS